ncbi:DUF3336 domain-containing protein [Acinetobacter ursingii]|uniref:DUF3336 domain-containing protein n=1 Tax=Acinetobacter ursingii TaxID=108980 RepID=UPI00029AD933|nr:DUF3336 domain-containing protein [Acinetobacter ursingii]ENV76447.1 hypothetical protein F944_01419 [Acinetobacter ursingii DSM 16037 = CIP 107286]MCU4495145.1 DUF3336 domain-containing protein [Acinetobacter ursingii]QQT67513.1 DUF3336 domain-containing protein [Acinetobacter ursingii]UYF77834.1 DUF3336 domain-containing protein [Acinetobacter ursingii]
MFETLQQDMNLHQRHRVKKLKYQLKNAESYDEWKTVALKLDEETGAQEWKYDNSSPYFNAEVISYRLNLLRKYRTQQRVLDALYLLQEGLTHDIANIGHPMLFTATYLGTKQLIVDYVEEVSHCLRFIAISTCQTLTLKQKINFFENCQKAYGQPALMFSGGATLGLFHSGVCKALVEQDLLPKVLSGSSAGAIMAGMLGTSSIGDIPEILKGQKFFTDAFHFRKLSDIAKGNGGLADVKYLKNFLIENLGDLTFAEAYKKSGLHTNVAVAPYDASQNPRIMNGYTAPNLLVWSAVLASCAVPVLFPPIRLTSKRYDGVHTPYMANAKWVDGSVRSDFPQEKMARLYNLNYTIASQVNPHVVPFMQSDQSRYRKDLLSWPQRILRRQAKVVAMGFMDFTRERLGRVQPVRRLLDHGYGIVGQRYYGDVNIIGRFNLRNYSYMLQNPRPELFKLLQQEGERATWPKISSIEIHARIGKTIQHCLEMLYFQETQHLTKESVKK